MHEPSDPDYERIDRDIRVNELKHRAEAAGGEMATWESDDAPPGIVESFWERVVAYEEAPDTSTREILHKDGIELPSADELDDATLAKTLWDLIRSLAERNTYLSSTGHLSDRELYVLLTEELLHEVTKDFPGSGWTHHIDILGCCSEEDIYLRHKYYADEEERTRWSHAWPDDEMPERVPPPYDRDRLLPKEKSPVE